MTEIQQTGAAARSAAHAGRGADVRGELRAYVEETFLYLHPGVELADGDQFLDLGIIDSLGFVELVDEVQARYGIAVQDVEITEESFGSIDALVAFVARKRAEGDGGAGAGA